MAEPNITFRASGTHRSKNASFGRQKMRFLWQGQKDLKLLRNPSCGTRNPFRAMNRPHAFRPRRFASLPPPAPGGGRSAHPARSACLGFTLLLPLVTQIRRPNGRRICVAGAEGLEPSARGFGGEKFWGEKSFVYGVSWAFGGSRHKLCHNTVDTIGTNRKKPPPRRGG